MNLTHRQPFKPFLNLAGALLIFLFFTLVISCSAGVEEFDLNDMDENSSLNLENEADIQDDEAEAELDEDEFFEDDLPDDEAEQDLIQKNQIKMIDPRKTNTFLIENLDKNPPTDEEDDSETKFREAINQFRR